MEENKKTTGKFWEWVDSIASTKADPSAPVIAPTGGDPNDAWICIGHYIEHLPYFQSQYQDRFIYIMKQRWLLKRTLEEVGSAFAVTRERIRQIEMKLIETISDPVDGLMQKGLGDRINWVEQQINAELETVGGYSTTASLERNLDWPKDSIQTWIVLNAATSALNQQQIPSRKWGRFGRLSFNQDLLSLHLQTNLKETVNEIVGPSGIMKLSALLITLNKRLDNENIIVTESNKRTQGEMLARLGVLKLIERDESDRQSEIEWFDVVRKEVMERGDELGKLGVTGFKELLRSENSPSIRHSNRIVGQWVSVGLTAAQRKIAAGILYGELPDGEYPESFDRTQHFQSGCRSDLIELWLKKHDYHRNTRAIDALCERYSEIFTKTNSTSWGLVGAGAIARADQGESIDSEDLVIYAIAELGKSGPVNKLKVVNYLSDYLSNGWINKIIDDSLSRGDVINTSTSKDPKSKFNLVAVKESTLASLPPKPNKRMPGQNLTVVMEVLNSSPTDLSSSEILLKAREIDPTFPTSSLTFYLYNQTDLIERTSNNRYRAKGTTSEEIKENISLISTINILRQIMKEAEGPLTVEEVIDRCEQIKPVRHSAIRGYLNGNYQGLFKKDEGGRFVVVKDYDSIDLTELEPFEESSDLSDIEKIAKLLAGDI